MKTTEELYRIQREIASKAILEDKLGLEGLKLIAGADQAFFYESKNNTENKDKDEAKDKQEKIHALENKTKPDLLVIDGCGVNHPRFAGLATPDVATVGVAKNLLWGSGEVPMTEGEARMIKYKGKEIGYYIKSKKGCRPIIIAPGHKISLQSSLQLIKNCICKHKLPEPTRMAHLYANKIKKELG